MSVLAALALVPLRGMAQQAASVPDLLGASAFGVADTTDPGPAVAPVVPDSLPPPDSLIGVPPWKPAPPQAVRAASEVVILNVAAVAINHLARDIPWSRPESWWDNVSGGLEWDQNDLRVNSLEHPWAGAVYFNVGRSNGLSFWAAVPITVGGSLFWEMFGEANAPSANDLLFTSLSGVAMGEPLHRVSLMVLDNQAGGLDRIWREATVLLFNPGLGLDRLSRGESWRHYGNSPTRRPESLRGGMALGARQLPSDSPSPLAGSTVGVAAFDLRYGDPFDGAAVQPFSSFTATAELMPASPDVMTQVGTRGILAAFGRRDGPTNRVTGLFLDFDYRWDRVVGFSEQAVGFGMLSRFGDERWRLHTDVSAEVVPIAATIDQHARPLVKRTYDFGAGVGGRVAASVEHRSFRLLTASYRAYWLATLNGASSGKQVQLAAVEGKVPLLWGLSVGAAYQLFLQSSSYADRATEHQSLPSLSVFMSLGS